MQLSVTTTLSLLSDLHDLGLVTYSGESTKATWTLTLRGREYVAPRTPRKAPKP
jgi:hypothetical protein